MALEPVLAVVNAYIAAWGEPNDAERIRVLENCWADEGTYTDPRSHVQGRAGLSSLIASFLGRRPDDSIILTSSVQHHHNVLRFNWRWIAADGSTVIDGMDFGELGSDGRLQRICGFFGPLPSDHA